MNSKENAKHVILFDCGDTIIDEATEEKDENGVTLRAELIPGADHLLMELSRRGYRLGLVADGFQGTFRNVLSQHGLWELFEAIAISENVGVDKPAREMFDAALEQLELAPPEDPSRIVMVGNNLARDIRGANSLGFTSVWIDWASRRSKTPADDLERPDHTIHEPLELLGVIESLER